MDQPKTLYPNPPTHDKLLGHPVTNCPIHLDVCHGSCWYFSLCGEKCVYPYEGSKVDANLNGEVEHFNFGEER
jgi:hypothetical protein